MQSKIYNRLLFFSLFFMTYWFFGNLYEEIVMIPNQLENTYEVLKAYQGYFRLTGPTIYFVPFTQLAVVVIWFLYFKTMEANQKQQLKKAGIFGVLAIGLTAIIVTQLNVKMFFGNLDKYRNQLYYLSLTWLIGNMLRLYLVGNSIYFIFKVYIRQQMNFLK